MILVYGRGIWNTSSHWSNYVNVFTDYCVGETTHPYEKPLSLIARLIRNHTNPGDVVLDPFAGSGTTCVAAKILGRRFIGIERDAEYVRIARTRLSATQPTLPPGSSAEEGGDSE